MRKKSSGFRDFTKPARQAGNSGKAAGKGGVTVCFGKSGTFLKQASPQSRNYWRRATRHKSGVGNSVSKSPGARGRGFMNRWTKLCTGLVLIAGMTPAVRAQVPTAAPPVPPGVAPGAELDTPPVGGKLGNLQNFCTACRIKLCKTQFGLLLNNALKPVSALSGGLVGDLCPEVTKTDLAKPPDD